MRGFFDFGEGTDVGGDAGAGGVAELVGKKIGVGGDDAEKIVEGVSDDLILRESHGDAFGILEWKIHLLTFLENELGFGVCERGSDGSVKRFGGKPVEGDATGRAGGGGLFFQIGKSTGKDSDDGESRIFRANFFDEVQALKIPGMNIDGEGVPAPGSERVEKFGERIEAADVERRVRGVEESLRKLGPCGVFAEEKDLEDRILH